MLTVTGLKLKVQSINVNCSHVTGLLVGESLEKVEKIVGSGVIGVRVGELLGGSVGVDVVGKRVDFVVGDIVGFWVILDAVGLTVGKSKGFLVGEVLGVWVGNEVGAQVLSQTEFRGIVQSRSFNRLDVPRYLTQNSWLNRSSGVFISQGGTPRSLPNSPGTKVVPSMKEKESGSSAMSWLATAPLLKPIQKSISIPTVSTLKPFTKSKTSWESILANLALEIWTWQAACAFSKSKSISL